MYKVFGPKAVLVPQQGGNLGYCAMCAVSSEEEESNIPEYAYCWSDADAEEAASQANEALRASCTAATEVG